MRHTLLAGLAATACLAICIPAQSEAGGDPSTDPLVVMTRNLYVGADIFRVVEADPLLVVPTIAEVYATVVQTNFAERAEVLADEVLLHPPHLIGLQEVSLVRRQSPGDILFGNPEPATDIDMDFLQMYLDALASRGLNYSVVASVENADIELPLLAPTSFDDIRLTDRDVILARDDVTIGASQTGNYADNVVIEVSGFVINFNRGYAAVDATVDGREYRFVNTHLEVGGQPTIQGLQADELIDILAAEALPIVLVGDFNASPTDPPEQAYARLAAAGFKDIWDERSVDDNDPGYTCCHGETLDDLSSVFDERIDLVLVRAQPVTAFGLVDAVVVGGNPGLVTPSGLWPSDHGGVVASFRLLDENDDADGDGVIDSEDSCLGTFNPAQRDTDGDGYGNRCDADFNQDGAVNFLDLAIFRGRFNSDDPDADLDGDGAVNAVDLGILRQRFYAPPGPSALVTP